MYYSVSGKDEGGEFAEDNGPYNTESEATQSAMAEQEATIGWSDEGRDEDNGLAYARRFFGAAGLF